MARNDTPTSLSRGRDYSTQTTEGAITQVPQLDLSCQAEDGEAASMGIIARELNDPSMVVKRPKCSAGHSDHAD